jgi:hypothetical protein
MEKDMPQSDHEMKGACHCGAVQFRVVLQGGLASARRCTCSYCRMRGAVAVSAGRSDLEITSGADNLTRYQFNTRTAEHYFCKTCGIYTHHRRRSNPDQFGVNAACLDGVSPFDFRDVLVLDGQRHPSDSGGASRVVGHLRFEPESEVT